MSDYEFPSVPEIEAAYRAAQSALLAIVPRERTLRDAEEGLHVSELISHVRALLGEADMITAMQIGPTVNWRAPERESDWDLVFAGADLDNAAYEIGDVDLGEDAFIGAIDWNGSALDRAARAYKRETRWDFAPGEAGVWFLMLAPVSAIGGAGGDESWLYSGHVVGFMIVHDRDHDGVYETVAHMWTAAAFRRRGVARRLLAEARAMFPITGVERPYTRDSAAFLDAVGDPGA